MPRCLFDRVLPVLIGLLFVTPVIAQRSDIPTGGPIPDLRGFNNKVDDPAATAPVEVIVRHVAGQVYVVAGAGGNIVVQAGDDGLLLVDDNFIVFWDQIMAAIRKISDQPIKMVVNTHWHMDHVQNNENLAKAGALIFAHPDTRLALMQQGRTPGRGGTPLPVQAWPVVTSAGPMTFHFNGEEVFFVPLKPSHTSGDVAVYFSGSDVWAFGDVFTTDYPAMGVSQGGTIENFIDNYNKALEMTTPNTIFVPGHAQLSTRDDLIAVRDAIDIIHGRFVQMVRDGMTLEQIRAARPSKEYDAQYATENFAPNDMQTSARWYQQMYEEALTHVNAAQ